MSINAVQKHRLPGLDSNFGSKSKGVNTKNTGVSSQAAANLKNTSTASSSNSIFNEMFKNKGSSFNRISGQNTLKGRHQVDLSRRRASLGNNGVRRSAEGGTTVFVAGGAQKTHHMSNFEKAMKYANVGMQAFQMGAQLFGGISNGQRLDAAMGSMGGAGTSSIQMASTVSQSAVSAMQNANTSGALSAAISNAESQLSSLESAATSGNFEANANTAKTNMDTYKNDVKTAEKGLKTADQNLKTADNGVKTATDLRESRLNALKNADAQFGAAVEARVQAQDGVNQASQNLTAAENALANTPETIPDGNGGTKPNPDYQTAKQSVETAKTAKADAEAKLKTAQEGEDKANQSRDKANTAANDALDKLNSAQKTLDTQKSNQTKAITARQNAECKCVDAEEAYANAQDAIQKFQESKHDIDALKSEITKQKARLTKMKEKEDKKLDKLTKKIDKTAAKNEKTATKIDASDGMNIRERYLSGRMESRNNKNAARLAEKEAILAGQRTPDQDE